MSEVQQIPFLGMQGNDLSDSYQDGACFRIINMRNRTGNGLEPVGLKELFRTINGDEQEWEFIDKVMYMPYVSHHETWILLVTLDMATTPYQKVISVMMNGNTILSQTVLFDSQLYTTDIRGVSVFGQYVVVSTNKGLYSFRNNPETTPNNWDEMAPLIPSQCFVRHDEDTYVSATTHTDFAEAVKSYIDSKATYMQDGRVRGHVSFRIGFRLFDGSIGLFSMPVYVYLGSMGSHAYGSFDCYEMDLRDCAIQCTTAFGGGPFTVAKRGYQKAKVQWLHNDNNIIDQYFNAKIIRSVVVLGTRLLEPSDYTNTDYNEWKKVTIAIGGVPYYFLLPPKIEEKTLEQLGSWYVVKEVGINDKDLDSQEIDIDFRYYNDIATFEHASIVQTDELLCPSKMKDISRTLHIWDIEKIPIISRPLLLEKLGTYPFTFDEDFDATTRLIKFYIARKLGIGYDYVVHNTSWLTDSPYSIVVFAKFRSLSEFSRVQSHGQWAVYNGYIALNNLAGALSDVDDIQVFLVSKTTNTKYKYKHNIPIYPVAGTPDSVVNLDVNDDNTNIWPQVNYLVPFLIKVPIGTSWTVDTADWELFTDSITNIDKKFVDKNRLQVSLEENPFILPAVRSYRVGVASNTIVGIGTVAEELSDGRYGDFPLFVFTSVGIYAMTAGSGGLLYNSVITVNDEVAISDEAIIAIKGTIVFMTKRGLLALEGRQFTNLSEKLALHSYLDNSLVVNEPVFLSQVNDPLIVNTKQNILASLQDHSIDSLVSNNCKLAYDSKEGEILLNSVRQEQDGTFTSILLVYTLATKTWHERTEKYNHITFAHPGYFLINAYRGTIYVFKASEEDNTSSVDCMIITQPISTEFFEAKSLLRMSLKCYLETVVTTDKKFTGSMLLYARNNKYRLVKGLQFQSHEPVTPIRNLSFSNPHAIADRYVIVFMALLSRAKSQLHGFVMEYQKRINSKIR